jgi:hypothetical protein
MTKHLFLPLAILVLLVSACTKEKSNAEKLTAGPWRLESIELSPAFDIDGDGTAEAYDTLYPCQLDDETVFLPNGTLTVALNDLCLPGDPDSLTGMWSFDAAETSLSLTYGMLPVTYTYSVFELTGDRLSLAFDNGTYTSIRHYYRP